MKKVSFIILLLFLGISSVWAQDDESAKMEKMRKEVLEHKMKYLAQEMELSEAQKKEFFELYEEMSESQKECYYEAVQLRRKIKENPESTDEDYQQERNALNEANAKWAQIQKEYDDKFATFLTPKQIYKMKEAEQQYRARKEEMRHNHKRDHHRKDKRD